MRCIAVGDTPNGMATFLPNTTVDKSTLDTSRRTLGLIRNLHKEAHFSNNSFVVSGAANCYGCRALGQGDFYLPGRRPLGTARGEPAPPDSQPAGPDRAAGGGGDDGRQVERRDTSTTVATSCTSTVSRHPHMYIEYNSLEQSA